MLTRCPYLYAFFLQLGLGLAWALDRHRRPSRLLPLSWYRRPGDRCHFDRPRCVRVFPEQMRPARLESLESLESLTWKCCKYRRWESCDSARADRVTGMPPLLRVRVHCTVG